MLVIHFLEFERKQQLRINVGFSPISLVCMSDDSDKSLLHKKRETNPNILNQKLLLNVTLTGKYCALLEGIVIQGSFRECFEF